MAAAAARDAAAASLDAAPTHSHEGWSGHASDDDDDRYRTPAYQQRGAGREVWQCGGTGGDFEVFDLNGVSHGSDAHLWNGQHNLEYYGEGEFFMFDNGYNTSAGGFTRDSSRMLVVALDAAKRTAKVGSRRVACAHTGGRGRGRMRTVGLQHARAVRPFSPQRNGGFDPRSSRARRSSVVVVATPAVA